MANLRDKEKERLLVELDFRLKGYNKMKDDFSQKTDGIAKKLEDLIDNNPSIEDAFPLMEVAVNLKVELAKHGEELLNWIRSNGVEDYIPYDLSVELESSVGVLSLPKFTMENLGGFRKDLKNLEQPQKKSSIAVGKGVSEDYGIQ
jgi:hypothetical protein